MTKMDRLRAMVKEFMEWEARGMNTESLARMLIVAFRYKDAFDAAAREHGEELAQTALKITRLRFARQMAVRLKCEQYEAALAL